MTSEEELARLSQNVAPVKSNKAPFKLGSNFQLKLGGIGRWSRGGRLCLSRLDL